MALKDIFSPLGGLEKLKITAFEDDLYETATATYVVMYNPTTFSQEFKSKWIPEEGVDPDGKQYQFRTLESDSVTFEFLFDATGASPPGEDVPGNIMNIAGGEQVSAIQIINEDKHVDRAIKEFLRIAQSIQAKTHTPNYLQINWGAYQFRGALGGATVNYKLFNSAGLPIRATVTANFDQSLSRQEQAAEAGRNSPDLTHRRMVKAGDTLPLIANEIYGDPSFYREVARVNNLNNFRRLTRGQQLILPPIKK